MDKHATISDLIKHASRFENGRQPNLLGKGTTARVFDLAEEGFPQYVLRVDMRFYNHRYDDHESLKNAWSKYLNKKLEATTNLTPVDWGVVPGNYGQAILQNEQKDIQICKKQDGLSLTESARRYSEASKKVTPPTSSTYLKDPKKYIEGEEFTLADVARLPVSAYEGLLRETKRLLEAGIIVDVNPNNILITKDSINWVDVSDSAIGPKAMIEKIENALCGPYIPGEDTQGAYEKRSWLTKFRMNALKRTIHSKLEQAVRNTGISLSDITLKHARFAKVKSIEGVAVKLSDTPQALQEALRRCEAAEPATRLD